MRGYKERDDDGSGITCVNDGGWRRRDERDRGEMEVA